MKINTTELGGDPELMAELKGISDDWEPEFKLLMEQPGMHPVTATIIAGDNVSAKRASRLVAANTLTPAEAVNHVGSYARFGWAVANLPEDYLMAHIAGLWSGSDPDDTNPEFLAVWRRAFAARSGRILDGSDLPLSALRKGWMKLYRGQSAADPLGISWTTRYETAKRFALGAGVRRAIKDPVVLDSDVKVIDVLGYITGRNEYEVIVDLEQAGIKKEHFI